MKRLWLLLLFMLILAGCATNNSALDDPVKQSESAIILEYEEPGTFEKMIADFILAIPNFIIRFLGLKDINELVFGLNQDEGLVYGLIPSSMWEGISSLFSVQGELIGYGLVIALSIWVVIMVFRAGIPMATMTIRDMTTGFFIFIGAMYFGSYLIQMIFGINTFLVRIGYVVASKYLSSAGIESVTDVGFFNLVAYGLGEYTTLAAAASVGGGMTSTYMTLVTGLPFSGVGLSFVMLTVVTFIALINFQYVNRMVGIAALIAYMPLVAYSSIFPMNRRAFDIWLRSILALTLTQGGQAIFLGLFYSAILAEGILTSFRIVLILVMIAALLAIPAFVAKFCDARSGVVNSFLAVTGSTSYQAINELNKLFVPRLTRLRGRSSRRTTVQSSSPSSPVTKSLDKADPSFGIHINMQPLTDHITKDHLKNLGTKAVKAAPKVLATKGVSVLVGAGSAMAAGMVTAVTGNSSMGKGVAQTVKSAYSLAKQGQANNKMVANQINPKLVQWSTDGRTKQKM